MESINKLCKEFSYNALSQGGACISWLTRNDADSDTGFDIEGIEDGKKVMIGVKATQKGRQFSITNAELDAMKNPKDFIYMIHRYRLEGDEIKKFNIYGYDKEKGVLVDTLDGSICTIESRTTNKDGVSIVENICTPKKKKVYALK